MSLTDLFESQAHEKHLTLELEVEPKVPDWLYGDVDRLRQIVTHLGNVLPSVFTYVLTFYS